MALAVADAIEQVQSLVVEAGTGIGKTYAYLVPVLLSGRRALVSTATRALQDQLFLRDLPRLVEARLEGREHRAGAVLVHRPLPRLVLLC